MIDYIILAIIQGFTEILPVSSSGHLVLAGYFFNLSPQNLQTDIVLHLATLVAILVFFSYKWVPLVKDAVMLKRESLMYILYIIIATLPAAIVGLLLKRRIEMAFEDPLVAAVGLLFTGTILIGGNLFSVRSRRRLNVSIALIVGVAQAIAIVPGISRSGITVITGILLGLSFKEAFEFSFLISIPAIIGGVLLDLLDTGFACDPYLAPASGVAILTAFLSLYLFKKVLNLKKFYIFGIYCILLSIVTFVVIFI